MFRALLSFIISLLAISVMAGCSPHKYSIYQFDNGDDYFCEGLQRIVDKDGMIGFADREGNIAIKPQFAFAFPFEHGIAKATDKGHNVSDGEHSMWISPQWFYINKSGKKISDYEALETRLNTFAAGKDARIGVAVIINGRDTVSVNGRRDFPMLSVYKFPQALAVADFCMHKGLGLNDTVAVLPSDLKENTWSPMRDHYGTKGMRLPLSELLEYSLSQSDNIACDVLFRLIGGPAVADSLMKSLGFGQIVIQSTEDDMHRDPYLCYLNRSTPIEMARLFDKFYRQEMRHDSPVHEAIAATMMSCRTGLKRLPAPLASSGAVIGHKTGTGDRNSQGRIIAVNDAGYIYLPSGTSYAIAVFIADSAYDMDATEQLIGDISEIVFSFLRGNTAYTGTYKNADDGSTLSVAANPDGSYSIEIELFRLTSLSDSTAHASMKGLEFTATDAAGNPISGLISFKADKAVLTITDSSWEYLPAGTAITFSGNQ